MLATFASRLVFAAWRLHFVPGPEDVSKITRRLIEASVCWAIVNFTPVGGMETDEEEEEDYSLDQPSMDSMHSPTSITVMWKPPGDE